MAWKNLCPMRRTLATDSKLRCDNSNFLKTVNAFVKSKLSWKQLNRWRFVWIFTFSHMMILNKLPFKRSNVTVPPWSSYHFKVSSEVSPSHSIPFRCVLFNGDLWNVCTAAAITATYWNLLSPLSGFTFFINSIFSSTLARTLPWDLQSSKFMCSKGKKS